ncbi:hypothetical protein K4E_23670 [Enterococcus thailandicus]|nr:hypothetical protein K4E_23670 [Enterococcus thailandicus]
MCKRKNYNTIKILKGKKFIGYFPLFLQTKKPLITLPKKE